MTTVSELDADLQVNDTNLEAHTNLFEVGRKSCKVVNAMNITLASPIL